MIAPRVFIPAAVLIAACRVEIGPPGGAAQVESSEEPSGQVMIYTSMYRRVIDEISPYLDAHLPGVRVEWLQGGSEKLATRLDAELAAGAPRADLIMTSDPFWYERLKREGHLQPYASIRALAMPRALLDRDGAFVTSRISTMVIAYNERLVERADVPQNFDELFLPRWRGRVTTPDPLGSGTTFTTIAFLVHRHGDALFERIKAAQTVSSGGNSSTLTRIESGEHRLGFVLLENVLAARRRGSPVAYRVPERGAVLVPGPIAILKGTRNPRAARAVYDLLLSPPVQKMIVLGDMHSPYEDVPAPAGAPELSVLLKTEHQWTPEVVDALVKRAPEIRQRFAQVMGGR